MRAELNIERLILLLLIASAVSMLGRKLRLPYTVGLVLTGVGLALSPFPLDATLTKELIFTAFLPPLIFEAAFQIPWQELRRDLFPILVLATLGVFLSAGVTALGLRGIAGWPWQTAILIGVLLAATDPVSVIATFKEAGITGRLRLLVEAESLFNDGTAAVLFGVALAATQGNSVTAWGVAQSFLVTVAGGVACGALIGGAALLLAGRTDDHLVEITFTMIAAYGSFLLAEHFHLSGVLATLTAGLLLGNLGSLGALTDRGRAEVLSFWEYIAFLVNSLIFLLIGIRLAHHPFGSVLLPALAAILLVLLGRAIAVYGCCALFVRSRWRVTAAQQHILFWGGLRGALALALALGLPGTMTERETLITVTFAVVAFSVIVQGLTVIPLLKRLRQIAPAEAPGSRSSC
ncbi:MAG TPA: sodium:proton antiporter [Chthonomonadaceae bacterium]|nr:sodium:proton antiporter [Chthonomonadaceae bacterium]